VGDKSGPSSVRDRRRESSVTVSSSSPCSTKTKKTLEYLNTERVIYRMVLSFFRVAIDWQQSQAEQSSIASNNAGDLWPSVAQLPRPPCSPWLEESHWRQFNLDDSRSYQTLLAICGRAWNRHRPRPCSPLLEHCRWQQAKSIDFQWL
jgi:hypothetical protein